MGSVTRSYVKHVWWPKASIKVFSPFGDTTECANILFFVALAWQLHFVTQKHCQSIADHDVGYWEGLAQSTISLSEISFKLLERGLELQNIFFPAKETKQITKSQQFKVISVVTKAPAQTCSLNTQRL